MLRRVVCTLLLFSIIMSSLPILSSDNQIEEKWSVEFGKYYKGKKLRSVESFGIDKDQNALLLLACGGVTFYNKLDINGNAIVNIPKHSGDFSTDPIMDDDGNIYTYMPWADNEYNCTYMKFDSNMNLLREIEIDNPLAHLCEISNKGNIFLARGNGISIEDVKHTITTIYAFDQTGFLDWDVSFITKSTMNRTRSSPFLDWKFTENSNGDLFVAYLDNLIKIDTNKRTVEWQRKLSQEIHTISVYERGVSVIYTNYTYGPILCSQISYENELINNFTLETKAMNPYYYDCFFNSEYYIMKLSNKRGNAYCRLSIISADGDFLYNVIYPSDSTIFRLYGLSNPTSEYYVLEIHYNLTTNQKKYVFSLMSFENLIHHGKVILSFSLWLILVIESSFVLLILLVRKRKRVKL